MRMGFVIGLAVVLFGATRCSRITDSVDEEPALDLLGVEWVLTSFQQANGVHKDIGSQGMSLTFLDDGRLEGRLFTRADPDSPGTEYFATYDADADGALSITPPEFSDHPGFFPHGSRWFEYHRALSNASLFEIEQERLRIVYDASWVLHYTARPETGVDLEF